MTRRFALVSVLLSLFVVSLPARQAAKPYFPPAGKWEARDGAAIGYDKAKLDEAIAFVKTRENQRTKDLAVDIPQTFGNEAPYNNLIGPTQVRAGMNGVVIHKGYVAATWGDVDRADMTFSVTKTFLSTVVGEAVEAGKIKSIDDKVAGYMPKGVDLFTSEHNAKITWNQLLRQTSDWSGELFTKPDWADRPPRGQSPEQWKQRAMVEPGAKHEYNDVRVNVLSLATLHVMKEPLPVVLKRQIMDPIGASNTWHWEAYENATVMVDGKPMPSVPGGGHHGGGMFINAWDMARFGYLFLRDGNWNGQQLVQPAWIKMARTATVTEDGSGNSYGFMNWYLNDPAARPDGTKPNPRLPGLPKTAVEFVGNGNNYVYVDQENDLVIVVRWISGSGGEFYNKVVGSLQQR